MRTNFALFAAIPALGLFPFVSFAHAADFNGDGHDDLAVGAPGETVNGFDGAGAVHVLFGGNSCLANFSDQVITEASFPGLTIPGFDDRFGATITTGDFDGDGYDDLAIGAIAKTVSGLAYAGSVFVTYGSAVGLDLTRRQVFNQDTKGIKDKVEPKEPGTPNESYEFFGRSLASGDFDADGYDDLVISVDESLGSKSQPKPFAGAIHVLRGSKNGIKVKGNRVIHQDTKGVPGKAKSQALFGFTMVAADFDQDGVEDLAVGAPFNVSPGYEGNGEVTILRGSSGKGLSGKKAFVIDEADAGGSPDPQDGHLFGFALAAGDFAGNGGMQLAIGAVHIDVESVENAGAVYVLPLAPGTLAVQSAQLWTRSTAGVTGIVQAEAEFGAVLAMGDFNADGRDDLAIGCPHDPVGAEGYAGDVTLLSGSDLGLTSVGFYVSQDILNVPDVAESGDMTGYALAAADFDSDGDADLAIGVAGEHISSVAWTGAVIVIEGSPSTILDTVQSHWIDKTHPAVPGDLGTSDGLGSAFGG